MKKSSFSGFEAPSDFNPNMNQYKQRNIELSYPSAQPPATNGTAKASIANWSVVSKSLQMKSVPRLKKRDILKEVLEKHDVKEETDVEPFRKLL